MIHIFLSEKMKLNIYSLIDTSLRLWSSSPFGLGYYGSININAHTHPTSTSPHTTHELVFQIFYSCWMRPLPHRGSPLKIAGRETNGSWLWPSRCTIANGESNALAQTEKKTLYISLCSKCIWAAVVAAAIRSGPRFFLWLLYFGLLGVFCAVIAATRVNTRDGLVFFFSWIFKVEINVSVFAGSLFNLFFFVVQNKNPHRKNARFANMRVPYALWWFLNLRRVERNKKEIKIINIQNLESHVMYILPNYSHINTKVHKSI